MRSLRTIGFGGLLLCVVGFVVASSAVICRATEPEYTIEDLGEIPDLSYIYSVAQDPLLINDAGVVIASGDSNFPSMIIRDSEATAYSSNVLDATGDGRMVVMGEPDAFGDDVVETFLVADYGQRPVRLPEGVGSPHKLNEAGQILTTFHDGTGGFAVVEPDGSSQVVRFAQREIAGDPDTAGGMSRPCDMALDLNDAGQVLGIVYELDMEGRMYVRQIWVWEKSQNFRSLDFGEYRHSADFYNWGPTRDLMFTSAGQILLPAMDADYNAHYILYDFESGQIRRLKPAILSQSLMSKLTHVSADGIPEFKTIYLSANDSSVAVGNLTLRNTPAMTPSGREAAMVPVVCSTDRARPLQELIADDSGWLLWSAISINNQGQIVGTGILDGQWHRYLLNPKEAREGPEYPQLDQIVPLRYVFSATLQPPFEKIEDREIELPVPTGEQSFIVLVVGPDIIGDDGRLQVESIAPGVKATPIAAKKAEVHPDVESEEPFDSGFGRLVKDLPEADRDRVTSMDAAFVQFDVEGGVLPGAKTFVINGVEGDWIMQNGTATAQMIVARSDWDGSHHQTDVAYHYDEVEVALKSIAPVDVAELEVTVLVDGKGAVLVGMESLVLKNTGQGVNFTSSPIRIAPNKARAKAMGGPAIVAREYSQITLVTGLDNEFVSRPTTSLMVYVTPARMLRYYPVIKSTNQKKNSYLWKEALQQAANIAGKKVVNWNDLTAEEAGEISNRIIVEIIVKNDLLAKRTVKVTVAHHAAMILLRRLFIEKMTEYLYVIPKKPNPQFLNLWREMVLPHAKDPGFGPAMVEVTMPGYIEKMTYGRALGLGSHYETNWSFSTRSDPSDSHAFVSDEDRQAFLGWRQAIVESILLAKETDIDDIEEMVQLTGEGFGPVVKLLLPRLVKLQERGTPTQLVWVPDTLARLAAQSVESIGDQARAIDKVGSADTAVVVGVASLVAFAPATVPTKILSLVAEGGMAIEAGSLVGDYFDSINAVDLALGASLILEKDRLSAAKARAIPGWGVTLGVAGSFLGLGAETYGLISSVRVARSIDRAMELLPELEKGGFEAMRALSREDQVSVLTAITASKSAQESRILRLDPKRSQLYEFGSKFEAEAGSWFDTVGFQSRDTAVAFDQRSGVGEGKVPKPGNPAVGSTFRINGPDGPEDVVLERFLGQGKFSDVYSIRGDHKRVVKIANDAGTGIYFRSAQDNVLNSQRIHKLLEDNKIFQLKILHFAPDAPKPYLIQEAIEPGKHHIFNWLEKRTVTVIYGKRLPVKVRLGLTSAITPDGTLPPEAQRAILRLFKKMANGPNPLAWEDGHIQNIFLVEAGNGYKAGILDQDRIAPFSNIAGPGGDIPPPDAGLYNNLYGMEKNVTGCGIQSLADRIVPSNAVKIRLARGTLSPSADFLMAKMLEYGKRYIRYNRKTGEFEKILFDPKIVMEKEFFPDLKQWVDPDMEVLLEEAGKRQSRLPAPDFLERLRERPARSLPYQSRVPIAAEVPQRMAA